MKVTHQNKKLLIILAGLLVFVAFYLSVYSYYNQLADELQIKVDGKQQYLAELQMRESNLPYYEEQIAIYEVEVEKALADYPSYISEEEIVLFIIELQDAIGTVFNSIGLSEPQLLTEFGGFIGNQESGLTQTFMSAYSVNTTTDTEIPYSSLINLIGFLYDYPKHTSIETINITADRQLDMLAISLDFEKRFLSYSEAPATDIDMPVVPMGPGNPFN